MNIGITIHLGSENESLWINGIKQNAIYLLKALTVLGHNVYLVNASKEVQAPYEGKVVWDLNEIPVRDWNEAFHDTEILIFLGATYTDNDIRAFKESGPGKKVIKYVCGNNYIFDMEGSMFTKGREDSVKTGYNQELDEVWLLPHQGNTNLEYLRVLHNVDADQIKIVPFIWDPMFIDISTSVFNNPDMLEKLDEVPVPVYVPGKSNENKKLACFEPNMNVFKWSMTPTLIVEDYFKEGGEFGHFTIFCGDKLLEQDYYPSVINNTKLFNYDPVKITWLPRIEMALALAKSADIILAHQGENALNYSYLDALYLQYPLVHNSPYLKDAGYYYEGFNIAEGKEQLKLAMNNHDAKLDEYNAKSEEVLTRYTIYNNEMIELYGKLLDNVVEPNAHELSYDYNWETNTYH